MTDKEQARSAAAEPAAADPAATAASLLESLNEQLLKQVADGVGSESLNRQIVESINLLNTQLATQTPVVSALASELLVRQASGLVAQSAASYFDSVTKLALAAQGVLLRKMTESIVNDELEIASESALGALNTHLLVGGAAAVAAATGALDGEGVDQALERINQSIARFSANLAERAANA
ncbi:MULTISPECIES: hypothetical protein [unclassified Pseudomonas]|uniref:hypothetical protein n=1 Tax=unclassified Pseudomonas TaxID=196821 RepID=UPI000A1F9561|nr:MULTISPECIES: hypothetical protein [unclassified Pseudomonas]